MKKLFFASLLFSASIKVISASENTNQVPASDSKNTPSQSRTTILAWLQQNLLLKQHDIKIDRKEIESFFESCNQLNQDELAAFYDANLEVEIFQLLTDVIKNQLVKEKNLHPRIAFLKAIALLDNCGLRNKNIENKQAAHDVLDCVEGILNKKTEIQKKNDARDEQATTDSSVNS